MPNCHLLSFKGPIQPQNAKELYPASYKGLGLSLASKELVTNVMKYMLSFTVMLLHRFITETNDCDDNLIDLFYCARDVR